MPRIIFKKRLTEIPRQKTNIYKMKVPKVNESTLLNTAKLFGMKGLKKSGKIVADRNSLSYIEGAFELTLGRRSGAMRFFDKSRWMVDDGKTDIRISDEKAADLGREVIRKYKLVSLRECRVLRISRLRVGSMKKNARVSKERTIDIAVLFQRMLDKIPVDGPGGKLMVYFDHKGNVTGIDKLWREINRVTRPVPHTKLRAPSKAEKNLERSWSHNFAPTIEVTDMRFAYFEMGMCDIQRTLQPAYIMPLEIVSPDSNTKMRSYHVYPAAVQHVGRIIPIKRPRPAEPVRG